jgi:hypothetical protein
MTSAATAATERQRDDDLDARISLMVRVLVAARRTDTRALAAALEMSRNSYYNRVNSDKPWHAKDVYRLARFFDIPVQDLYDGVFRTASDVEVLGPLADILDGPDGPAGGKRNSPSSGARRGLRIVGSDQVTTVASRHAATPIAREAASQGADLDSAA